MTTPSTQHLINRIGELEEQVHELKRELLQILQEVTTIRTINNNPMCIIVRLDQLERRTREIRTQVASSGAEVLNIIEELYRREPSN